MKILFLNWAPIVRFGMGPGFQQLGHEVAFLEPSEDHAEGLRNRIASEKPDYLFTEGGVGREDTLLPVIEQSGIPHIYWAIEDPVAYNLSLAYGKKSILTLTTHREWLAEIYEPNGVEAINVPFACNPEFHKPGRVNSALSHPVVFVGNNYDAHPNRKKGHVMMLDPFLQNGCELAVYGNDNWVNGNLPYQIPRNCYKGYLSYLELPDLCASSPFILGIHSIDGSTTMQSMRTFEVLGCGGFFFTQHTSAIEAMFVNHKHLVWSTSPEETIELYDYYVDHPDEMDKIRTAGREFVYANHTYAHRAADIMSRLAAITGGAKK